MTQEHESNRRAWDEAAEYYRKGLEASIKLLNSGGMSFCPPELPILKKLRPHLRSCVHLQCAGGEDSLSLINFGAQSVLGIDISEEMIRVARAKSEALRMNARWLVSDIIHIPPEYNDSADFIYTGKGAINWMMDIDAWARTVARLLKPGGVFFLFEGHPITYLFDPKAEEIKIDSVYRGYFSGEKYSTTGWPETYVGKLKKSEAEQAEKFEKAWPVSTVISALLKAGLRLEHFGEYPDAFWQEFEHLPENLRKFFPNTYSVVAIKPENSP